jgi:tetratricopeptide (TPR) repeat protein
MPSNVATRRLARQMTEAADLKNFLAANRHRFAPETVAGLKEEVDRLVEVDLRQAEPLAFATRNLAALLDDPVSLGYGDAAMARILHFGGRFVEAEPLYRAAIERLRGAKRSREAAALEVQYVALLLRLGRAAEALGAARRARRALRRSGDRRLLAQLENNVSNVHYFVLERYRPALVYLDRARALFEELGDERSLAFVDYNRANALLGLDRPHEAIELFERAERSLKAAGMARAAAHVSYITALTLGVMGRYGEALPRYYAARDRAAELGDKVHAALSSLYLAELNLRLNIADEAADLASTAFEQLSALEGHEAEAARALIVRAHVAERRRDVAAADEGLRRAQGVYDRLTMPVLAAGVRLMRAELALSGGDVDAAASLASEAEQVYARGRLPVRRAWARLAQARVLSARGEAGRALRLARASLRIASRGGDPWLEYRAQEFVGELELGRGRRDAGVAALERAVAGIEELRSRIRAGEVRAAFLGDKLSAYERLVALNLERGGAEGLRAAFRYVEMAKSRALADLMSQGLYPPQAGGAAARDSRLREQLAHRLEELSWYNSRIDREREKGEQRNARLDAHLRVELTRCEHALAGLYRRLELEDAALAELFASEPVGVDELAGELAPDEAAVEFFVAGGRVSAFVVTRDGPTAFRAVAELRDVERHLAGLRFQLEKFALGSEYARAHGAALRRCADNHLEELYRKLVAPLAGAIEGRRLLFVPHGSLHYVPMHALKGPDGRYLIESNEVSYCPSATVYRLCSRRPAAPGDGRFVGVGLPDGRTPHINEELDALARLFPDAVLLEGERARKAAFLDLAPRARFLHLATHGYFRQDNPMFSSVRLADAPLSFYDVFDLGLGAELVTLSACNTGLTGLSPGDELCGLMRGFLHAGAPSLVVSLWAVNDRSTSELMQSFYRHLRGGADKRAALRSAELEVLDRYGHPYYWAPFVLMGKT